MNDVEPKDSKDSGSGIGWRIVATVAIISAAASVALLGYIVLSRPATSSKGVVHACILDPQARSYASKDSEQVDECPPKDAVMMDGLVTKTKADGFRMRVIKDGDLGKEITLYVRPADRPYIDIAHAATHAALGQPIRVYTAKIDGRSSVVYMQDTPLVP